MSLRLKLLLLGLLTLVLPWAGCRYAREMESALQEAERQSLTTMAQTIATSIRGREDLLYRRDVADVPSESPQPRGADFQPVLLASEPYLDGYADEWPAASPLSQVASAGADRLRVLLGVHEQMLYAWLDVRDARVVFDSPERDALDPAGAGDRIWIGFEDADGVQQQLFLATSAAGPVRARRIESREYGRRVAVEEPRVTGAWQVVTGGYRIELRIPLSLLGSRLGFLVDDRDVRGGSATSYGFLRTDDLRADGRLIVSAPELRDYLLRFAQPGLQLTVVAPNGEALATASSLDVPIQAGADPTLISRLYRRFLERPGKRRLISTEAPIDGASAGAPLGALRLAQRSDRWLTLRDRALTRLLNFTFAASALVVLAMVVFAARLAFRLARLRRASETALTREGLVTEFPDAGTDDELGDVSRSFATLLGRLGEYTAYLRTLAGKLAHELRTPLAIVRSSLENLESERDSPQFELYAGRAREGVERLNAILIAMGAATRVEEAIQGAERTRFDLAAIVRSAVEAYQAAFPERRFVAELPQTPVMIDGAPELIVQMLDKLVDNAVDFSPPQGRIVVRVQRADHGALLDVENAGPLLARGSSERLFESLWQSRPGNDGRLHLGLGLYIVRLIAGFHGGAAAAANLPDGSGVRFRVSLMSQQ